MVYEKASFTIVFKKKNLRCHIRPIKAFSKTPPKVHRMHFKRQNLIAHCSAVKLNFKHFSFQIICSLWTKIIFVYIIISLLPCVRCFYMSDRDMDVSATSQKSRLCCDYKRNCTFCTTSLHNFDYKGVPAPRVAREFVKCPRSKYAHSYKGVDLAF